MIQPLKMQKKLAGYNMLVTSELNMSYQEIYKAYHNLWRIEESFRIMKSELDAKPVYLQKEKTITGHFLICYLAVLLTLLLQFKVLKNEFSSEDIFSFIRDFRVAKISDRKYMNLARNSTFIKTLSEKAGLPITSYFLSNGQIKKMLSHRFYEWLSTIFYISPPKDRLYLILLTKQCQLACMHNSIH